MSQPDENRSEFYVGYLPQMPPGYARLIRPVVALLLASAALFAYVLPKLHNSYDLSRSDYRDIRDFEGLLLAKPAPQLVVMRPGSSGSQQLSSYLLVGRGKSGPKIDVEALDGKYVRVKGSLIYRGAGGREPGDFDFGEVGRREGGGRARPTRRRLPKRNRRDSHSKHCDTTGVARRFHSSR